MAWLTLTKCWSSKVSPGISSWNLSPGPTSRVSRQFAELSMESAWVWFKIWLTASVRSSLRATSLRSISKTWAGSFLIKSKLSTTPSATRSSLLLKESRRWRNWWTKEFTVICRQIKIRMIAPLLFKLATLNLVHKLELQPTDLCQRYPAKAGLKLELQLTDRCQIYPTKDTTPLWDSILTPNCLRVRSWPMILQLATWLIWDRLPPEDSKSRSVMVESQKTYSEQAMTQWEKLKSSHFWLATHLPWWGRHLQGLNLLWADTLPSLMRSQELLPLQFRMRKNTSQFLIKLEQISPQQRRVST